MYRYVAALGVVVLVVAWAYFSGFEIPGGQGVAPGEEQEAETEEEFVEPFVNFSKDGTIAKDEPGLEPGEWYLFFEEADNEIYAARLAFDEWSICGSATASGTCKPSVFINGRGAHVEGEVVEEGTAVYVVQLTFAPRN